MSEDKEQKEERRKRNNIRMMVILIVLFAIAIITRWEYISKELTETWQRMFGG